MTIRNAARVGAVAAAMAVSIAAAAPAYAQLDRTARPYRALFDSAPNPDSKQSLDASASLSGGYDDDVLAASRPGGGVQPGRIPTAGGFAGAAGALSYTRRTEPLSFYARTSSSTHYFPGLDRQSTYTHASVGAAAGMPLWKRARLSVTPAFSYASQDRVHAFDVPEGEDQFLDGHDYATIGRRSLYYRVSTSVAQQLGAQTSLSVGASGHYSDILGEGADQRGVAGTLQFRRQITRNATAVLGYGFRRVEYIGNSVTSAPRESHSILAGVDYARPLSLTRRTFLTFSTGSALVAPFSTAGQDSGSLHAHLVGDVSLVHEMGRSWRAQVGYFRGVRFIEEIADPILSNATSGSLAGYLAPRLDLSIVAAYTGGWSAAGTRSGRQYQAYTGSVQLRYALQRYVSLYGQYLHYHYQYAEGLVLLRALPPGLDRQGVRAGISFSAPLLH
jgi:hypothetical protein